MTDIAVETAAHSRRRPLHPAIKWVVPALLVLLSSVTAWWLTGGVRLNIHVPINYDGDGLLILVMIKRVMEGAWLFQSNLMGAPFGSSFYDYPIPDSGSLFILKLLGLASGSPYTAVDLFYLLGYPVNAVSAYFVLRKFKLPMALSFAGGFVFTILPFHFERLAHLFYTWYFVAPLFIWYAYRLYCGTPAVGAGMHRPTVLRIRDVLVLLVLSCFGVYYSFFGVLAFFTAGLMRFAGDRSLKNIAPTISAILIVTAGIFFNITPNLIDRYQNGVNQEAADRSPVEAEIYGLKTVQLLLPRSGHRFPPFAKLNAKYSQSFPLINENVTASLGIIGSVGFLALMLSFLAPRVRARSRFFFIACITLVLLLFCTVGGFSSVFALVVSPMIRAWNRASVFIAFTSIAASLILIQAVALRTTNRRRATMLTTVAAGALCAFSVWDQTTPACGPCQDGMTTSVHDDIQFVAGIEQRVPKSSVIYQLPYMPFPETPPMNGLSSYGQARGYLNSTKLGWTWGSMKGREGDAFFRALAAQPMEQQVEVARHLCFAGIYVDREGYADAGAAVQNQLQDILGVAPALISASREQIFYPLIDDKHPACTLPSNLSPEQIIDRAGLPDDEPGVRYPATLAEGMVFSHEGTPGFLSSLHGLSAVEPWGRWSDANVSPSIALRFKQALPSSFVLHLRLRAIGPNVGHAAHVTVGNQSQTFSPVAASADYALKFSNVTDVKVITITPAQPISPNDLGISVDSRKLGLGLEKLWIDETK